MERIIPSRALYRGHEPVRVLGYAGGGRFLVLRGELATEIRREHLTFLPGGSR